MNLWNAFLNILYPNTCCFCGKVYKEHICPECAKTITYVEEPVCKKCGKPIRYEEEEYCDDCKKQTAYYEQGRSVWVHRGPVRWSIYQFKYRNQRHYGKFYAKEMVRIYGEQIKRWGIELIVPVPLHPTRKRKRGYNQAEILALLLGKRMAIPVAIGAVVRCKKTNPQKALNQKERRLNMKDAFNVKNLPEGVKNILVIDDIYTTGNTVNEMAKILRNKGVKKVFFLTISIGQGF